MEKSRAIDLLDNLIGMIEDNQDNDYDTAFRMAIEALKAQLSQEGTTSDLISRAAAQTEVMMKCERYTLARESSGMGHVEWSCDLISVADAMDAIRELPPAQPEPHEGYWIWVAGNLECSKCHTRYPDLYPDYDNSVACPHCGAKMKGVTK